MLTLTHSTSTFHSFFWNFIYFILGYRWVDLSTYFAHISHLKIVIFPPDPLFLFPPEGTYLVSCFKVYKHHALIMIDVISLIAKKGRNSQVDTIICPFFVIVELSHCCQTFVGCICLLPLPPTLSPPLSPSTLVYRCCSCFYPPPSTGVCAPQLNVATSLPDPHARGRTCAEAPG